MKKALVSVMSILALTIGISSCKKNKEVPPADKLSTPQNIKVKEFRADIRQDYQSGPEGEAADADLLVRVCPMVLAGAGFRLLWQGGRLYLKFLK